MIDAIARFIEEGRVQFFTLSSVDSESWLCDWKKSTRSCWKCTVPMNAIEAITNAW